MVIVERTCAGCGHRFSVDRDQLAEFCSGLCAGTPSAYSLLFAVQQIARLTARGQ